MKSFVTLDILEEGAARLRGGVPNISLLRSALVMEVGRLSSGWVYDPCDITSSSLVRIGRPRSILPNVSLDLLKCVKVCLNLARFKPVDAYSFNRKLCPRLLNTAKLQMPVGTLRNYIQFLSCSCLNCPRSRSGAFSPGLDTMRFNDMSHCYLEFRE